MAQKVTTTNQTKHVDIRYKFVNKYVEDEIVKIIFVKSKENDTDIFTKNLNGDLHAAHSSKFIKKKQRKWIRTMTRFAFGEIPTYQMKNHCDAIQNQMRKKEGCQKVSFMTKRGSIFLCDSTGLK